MLSRLLHVKLNNRTLYKVAFGVTPDISAYLVFHWYQEVLYYDPSESFPESREKRGRFVGVAHNVGDALTFKILIDGKDILSYQGADEYSSWLFKKEETRFVLMNHFRGYDIEVLKLSELPQHAVVHWS